MNAYKATEFPVNPYRFSPIRGLRARGLSWALLTASLLLPWSMAQAGSLKICSDNNTWYPFTFAEGNQAQGLHIDIVRKALTNLGYQLEIEPLPWVRCLKQAEDGAVDAVATASYKDERAVFLDYPDDATTAKSAQRVMQVEYVVVSPASSNFIFAGDVSQLPAPVLAPRGYSIADDLRKQNVTVDDSASGDENNLRKLLRADKGVMVTIPEVVRMLNKQAEFAGKTKIHDKPLTSKSYFLPLSKKSALTREEKQKIWAEIAKVRDDEAFMAEMAAKY